MKAYCIRCVVKNCLNLNYRYPFLPIGKQSSLRFYHYTDELTNSDVDEMQQPIYPGTEKRTLHPAKAQGIVWEYSGIDFTEGTAACGTGKRSGIGQGVYL